METEKMKIELNQEEAQLLDELNVLQEKIGKYDPEEMNRKMFDELQKAAIDSLVVALNISDMLENSSTISSNIRDFQKRQNLSTGELKGEIFDDTKLTQKYEGEVFIIYTYQRWCIIQIINQVKRSNIYESFSRYITKCGE